VTQLLLWGLVDELGKTGGLDYLQVFDLGTESKDGVTYQSVTHTQEQPPYREKHLYILPEAVKAKIFCIDDETHSTMLLADEY
jgi:hypothetical protein